MGKRRTRRALALALAVAVLGLAAWHYATLYRDATAARAALLDLEDTMAVVADLGLDTTAEDLDAIEAKLAGARERIGSARAHVRWDPLLQTARWLPVAGDQVISAEALLDIAAALVEAGTETAALARTVLDLRESHEGGPITTPAFELLDAAGPSIERIDHLVAYAVERRLEIGDRALVGPLDDARRRVDEHLPRVATLIDQASAAREVLPGLLGFEGPRRYLLLSLNNAELMPGGGLVTTAGLLTVQDGRVTDTTFRNASYWVTEWRSRGGEPLPAPPPLERHLLRGHSWNLGVSSWEPDFPTWAPQALDLYRMAWGDTEVDGVVAVDLDVLEALLRITGGKTIDAPGFGDVYVTSDNAFIELERVTRPPEDTWRRSKVAVGTLQEAILRDILALPAGRWNDLADSARRLGQERHLQVLLFDPAAQSLVADLGWDGRLRAPSEDFVHLSEASVNGTKLNAVFSPEATYTVDVSALGAARHHLVLRYENTVQRWAEGRDPRFVERLMYDGQYGAYLRAFLPRDATAFSATVDGIPTAIEDQERLERHRWFGLYFPVPAGATREVALSWRVPLATTAPGSYRLDLQKQPGTAGLCLDLEVTFEGQRAGHVEVTGGTKDRAGRVCLTTDVTIEAARGR